MRPDSPSPRIWASLPPASGTAATGARSRSATNGVSAAPVRLHALPVGGGVSPATLFVRPSSAASTSRAEADGSALAAQRYGAAVRAAAPIDATSHVQAAMTRLAQTPAGARILERLRSDGTVVTVAPVAGPVGAIRSAALNQIHVAPQTASQPGQAALAIAYEAHRLVDERTGVPETMSSVASAYTTQAAVAAQLGVRDPGLGTAPDGSVRGFAQTVRAVSVNPRYRALPAIPLR